jgi:hypothetical protein
MPFNYDPVSSTPRGPERRFRAADLLFFTQALFLLSYLGMIGQDDRENDPLNLRCRPFPRSHCMAIGAYKFAFCNFRQYKLLAVPKSSIGYVVVLSEPRNMIPMHSRVVELSFAILAWSCLQGLIPFCELPPLDPGLNCPLGLIF